MAQTHRFLAQRPDLRGPGSTRNWPVNDRLDPIATDYSRVRPWAGTITNDGEAHRYLSAHDLMIEQLLDVTVCEYQGNVGGRPTDPTLTHRVSNPTAVGDASDHLYVFEGATGSFDGRPPSWSLTGTILEKHTDASGYDVHIAFRGSQSGNGTRAAYQGFVLETGNPDWVTDMEIFKSVADARFSPEGEVVLGLRDSVLSSFGSIVHSLEDIARRNERPPRQVRVTGHSLGGALAVLLGAALTVGKFAPTLPEPLRPWPWRTLAVTTFGAPKSGDEEFATHFDQNVDARRVWVEGDPLVEFPLNSHVGRPVPLHSDVTGTANHEPALTRRLLVSRLRWEQPEAEDPRLLHEPWRSFSDLGSALFAAEQEGDSVGSLFPTMAGDNCRSLVDLAATTVDEPSSYRVGFTKFRQSLRKRSHRVRSVFALEPSSVDEMRRYLRRFRGIQPGSTVENYLRRVFIVSNAVRRGWSTTELLDDETIAATLGTYRRPRPVDGDHNRAVARASGPPPSTADRRRVEWILRMRKIHFSTVAKSTESTFRKRVPPVSAMPPMVPACSHYEGLEWLPQSLMVPRELPAEAQLLPAYKALYYGLGKVGFSLYERFPIGRGVPWDPAFEWNRAFPANVDGWVSPTTDDSFVRLRTEGPNPFMLKRVGDGFELDFSDLFEGVLPPICARFDITDAGLVARNITVGAFTHSPGDATWDQAKRVVNAADVRAVPFVRHLLEVHFIVGAAFASAAYSLPTWHPLRPFMHFFSYGTLQVNDFAYRAFFAPSSYFIGSGFMTGEAAEAVFGNRMATFSLDDWIPPRDVKNRGIDRIQGHPYVEDALTVWSAFEMVVSRYLDELQLDDDAVAGDNHLQSWYLTLTDLIPNLEARSTPLDRKWLVELCCAFLYNNVVHEVCGDLSPILGSQDPDDKAIINLAQLIETIGDGDLATPLSAPSMADVFLMDQASYASGFHVGGNNLLDITAARWVDEPKLTEAVIDLQKSLRQVEAELLRRNAGRKIRFSRMLPSTWEASISF